MVFLPKKNLTKTYIQTDRQILNVIHKIKITGLDSTIAVNVNFYSDK